MAKKSDTWMAFYVGDYTANTLHLTRAQHGSYLLLILAAFKNGGWLPNDDARLASVGKMTPKEWAAERALLAEFFDVTSERWTHARVSKELEKATRLTAKRKQTGAKGAAKRWQDDSKPIANAIANGLQNDGPSEPEPPSEEQSSSGAVAPDVASLLFSRGREWLQSSSGKSEQACRSLLGKWRKNVGDEALVTILGRAQREAPFDAVEWIEGAIKAHKGSGAGPLKFN